MADGPKPPKGWLIAGLVMLGLALASCGAGGFGCVSFVNQIATAAEESGSTALGEETTFSASSDNGGLILASVASPDCTGEDSNGNRIQFTSPSAGTTGNVTSGENSYDLAYQFDTVEGESYTLRCEASGESSLSDGRYLVITVPSLGGVGLSVGAIFGGVGFAVLGVIFLIIGLVRRSGWKKRNGPGPGGATGVPSGYAPPPPGAGGFPPAAPPPPAPAPDGFPPAPAAPPAPPAAPPAPPAAPPAPPAAPPAPPTAPPPPLR